MKKHSKLIKTPSGGTLGQRTFVNGKLKLHYKQGNHIDDFTMEELVELISGIEVERIIYKSTKGAV